MSSKMQRSSDLGFIFCDLDFDCVFWIKDLMLKGSNGLKSFFFGFVFLQSLHFEEFDDGNFVHFVLRTFIYVLLLLNEFVLVNKDVLLELFF